MAITKRPPSRAAEDFIKAAPDAAAPPPAPSAPAAKAKGVMLGRQRQIALALPPDLLERVDACARDLAISRAAFIKQAISRAVKAED